MLKVAKPAFAIYMGSRDEGFCLFIAEMRARFCKIFRAEFRVNRFRRCEYIAVLCRKFALSAVKILSQLVYGDIGICIEDTKRLVYAEILIYGLRDIGYSDLYLLRDDSKALQGIIEKIACLYTVEFV